MFRRKTMPGSAQERWQHVIFWTVFVGLMVVSVVRSPGPSLDIGGVAIRVGVLLLMTAVAAYVNLGLLVPKLLLAKRWVAYALSLMATILLIGFSIGAIYFSLLNEGSQTANGASPDRAIFPIEDLADRLPGQGAKDDGARGPNLTRLASIFVVHTTIWVGALSLLHFGVGWVRNRNLEKRKLEAELTALKAQLNPHFLFNSLNNIYALALDKSDFAPSYVLKLADLMRYILNDSQAVEVSMRNELAFVRNYFDLERTRADGHLQTEVRVGAGVEELKIPPLLFLPFIENAFKHGVKLQTTQARVEFAVELNVDGGLEIEVNNNQDPFRDRVEEAGFLVKSDGMELANARRRLELLYPHRYELKTFDRGDRFQVLLRIDR